MRKGLEALRSAPGRLLDMAIPPESRTAEEMLTVLNAVTAVRGVMEWRTTGRLNENPRENLGRLIALKAADKESWLAKLGDLPNVGPAFQKAGFRRSEVGRRLDPIIDKVIGAKTIIGGIRSGIVPRKLGTVILAQKAVMSGVTIRGEATGHPVEVRKLGQVTEAVIDGALIGFYASEVFENPRLRRVVRTTSEVLAGVGVVAAAVATVGYANDAGVIDTPRIDAFVEAVDSKIQQYAPFV